MTVFLLLKKKNKNRTHFMAMNEWKNIHSMLYKADTPRLRSTMQNICFDFRCYFEANGQNHTHFCLIQVLKNIMTPRDLAESSWRENSHLLVNPIPKLTIVLIWKTPPCLNFGKTSSRAVTNLPQRKLWVWAANDARPHKNFITPNFGERVLLRKR